MYDHDDDLDLRDEQARVEWQVPLQDALLGLGDSLDEHVSALEVAIKLRELADTLDPPATPAADAWSVTYAHPDCAACEDCAEGAITHAKATGSTVALFTQTDGGHWGEAERS